MEGNLRMDMAARGFRKWINERGCVMADTEDRRCQPDKVLLAWFGWR
jgi:hypothetical protein